MSVQDEINRNNRMSNKKGSFMGFAVSAVVLTSIFGLSPLGIVLIAAASYGIGKVAGIMSQPLDTRTHNQQDEVQRDLEDLPKSGDTDADSVIARGQEMLRQVRAANDAIPDRKLSEQMDRLENICVQIFKTVSEKPEKASQIRKFMSYYLPTTLKMLNSYRIMQERGVSAGDLREARVTLERGMDMVLTACQKQLDNLFKDTMLDVSTDIDVLEQMLKRDGFTESAFDPKSGATVASMEMDQGVPVLHVPDSEDQSEEYRSYYQKKASGRS